MRKNSRYLSGEEALLWVVLGLGILMLCWGCSPRKAEPTGTWDTIAQVTENGHVAAWECPDKYPPEVCGISRCVFIGKLGRVCDLRAQWCSSLHVGDMLRCDWK